MLGNLREGKVYEVLLVTSSNATPVGVVRRGDALEFKLFPGRSFEDLLRRPKASVQVTNDVELIVRLALNLPVDVGFGGKDGHRWIEDLPGWYGSVEYRLDTWRDNLGESRVLIGRFVPRGEIPGSLPVIPWSRADCRLLEMAVHFTRFLVSHDEKLVKAIAELYSEYRRFGGDSEVAEYMMSRLGAFTSKGKRENF